MKAIILLISIVLLASCGGGGGGSSEPSELNPLLFEGNGRWRLTYTENSVQVEELLTFAGDECQYKKTVYAGGYPNDVFDKRLLVTPVGTSRIIGTNINNSSEQWIWSYRVDETTLELCDSQKVCYSFLKY